MRFSSFYSSRRQHLAHRLGQRMCLRRCISAIRRPFSMYRTYPLRFRLKGSGEAGLMGEEAEGAGMGMVGAEDEGDST
jgi:hypothetical protein